MYIQILIKVLIKGYLLYWFKVKKILWFLIVFPLKPIQKYCKLIRGTLILNSISVSIMAPFFSYSKVGTVPCKKNWTIVQYYVVKQPFRPPSIKQNDTNDISFESPNIGLLEFIKKLGVGSSRGRHYPIN